MINFSRNLILIKMANVSGCAMESEKLPRMSRWRRPKTKAWRLDGRYNKTEKDHLKSYGTTD